MASPNKTRPFHGSERPLIPGSVSIGPVEATERIRFVVLLKQRPGSPEPRGLEHWQKTPPGDRKYLSAEEYFKTHGAAEDDVDAVVDYLKSERLRVIESHAGRRRIEVEGTAGEINAAFGITLNLYRAPRRFVERHMPKKGGRLTDAPNRDAEQTHRGFEGPINLPPRVLDAVTAIIGLDNRRLGGPAATGTGDPSGAQYLSPIEVAKRYKFPTFSAAGQTVGLFEAADDGAAYLSTDITSFISSLPPGSNTPPILTDIGLLGETNNTALVPGLGGGVIEATLDVAVVAAVAQGVNINVYFTQNTEAGWEAFLDRATFPLAGDNPPSVISASWILQPDDSVGGVASFGISGIGDPTISGTLSNTISGKLQQAAARGLTVLMAIGDWGSANQVTDKHCHVSYPNSDPWVTACGGTILGDIAELTWSDANTGSQFENGIYDATGGGVSDTFPIPPYQTAAGVLPISKNDGNVRRGLPDVAGMVGMDGFFLDGFGGPGQNGLFGTSAVSPLYAALIAVINGFLGHNVGFLNPTLYEYGPQICNDITFGNNDYGPPIPPLALGTPDSPFYTSDIGWDPCTGWGSINGLRLLAALAPAPIIETAIAGGPFASTCLGKFSDEILTINNSGFAMLLISNIVVSPATDFVMPSVASYPLAVSPGTSIDVILRFKPSSLGTKTATVTIFSNDLFGPHKLTVTGTAPAPRLVLAIADSGDFGNVCVGSFKDEPLVLNNSGSCLLEIDGITSSSGEFQVPEALSFPISIGAGSSLALPIRFKPTGIGTGAATLTVTSNDPAGPRTISVSGTAPSGKLAVCGSTYFGEIDCGIAQKTLSICNVGDCSLFVSSVAFSRKRRHFKLINNPFPAKLHPGSCLGVVIQYEASCDPECCELVIHSDDPAEPVKVLDVVAFTRCEKKCCCEEKPSGCGCQEAQPRCDG